MEMEYRIFGKPDDQTWSECVPSFINKYPCFKSELQKYLEKLLEATELCKKSLPEYGDWNIDIQDITQALNYVKEFKNE